VTVYSVCDDDVRTLARTLIHSHHNHLSGMEIRYVFRDTHQESRGKEVWAKTRLVGGLNAWLAGDGDEGEPERFFLIEIARDVWDLLGDDGKSALIDHELCHCRIEHTEDGEARLSIRPHDVEDFVSIVERHGLWNSDVRKLVETGMQGTLFDPTNAQPTDQGTGETPEDGAESSAGSATADSGEDAAGTGSTPRRRRVK
jgi:Putative phage metallopeptidase